MNKDLLRNNLKIAMKNRDQVRLDTIRGLMSEIQYEEIQKKVASLSETEMVVVLQRELKKRKEAIEISKNAGREEVILRLNEEISILESFLPAQLSKEDLGNIINDFLTTNESANVGLIMKYLKEKYSGQYDSRLASDLAKTLSKTG